MSRRNDIIELHLTDSSLAPHLGHLYTSCISDTISRFEKLTAVHNEHIFCTGTDEHGEKVLRAATLNNTSVGDYCKDISGRYKELWKRADINFTDFIRTTEERHKKACSAFWTTLVENNAIYKADYTGWYCVSDETFLSDSQLVTDDKGKKFSLESGHPVEWTSEENYMFKLSKYQDDIIYWARHENRIAPQKFNKILLDTLYQEILPDLSVSRPKARMSWGIPVPNDSTQNIYVWLDALVNYLTVAGYPDKLRVWPPSVHVVGKDILKFHGIYWPAFLIAANFAPPERLLVHSHWTVDGQKMSKSKLNVIDPMERADTYTMEGIRYFLLREGTFHNDGSKSSVA
jgi:methionyl-tRNA synthetase